MIASFAHKWRKPWIGWSVTLFAPLFCKLSKRPRFLVSLFLYLLFASSVFIPSPHSLLCSTALVVVLCRQLGWRILRHVPSIGKCHILFLQIDLFINFVYQKLFLFCIPNASTRCYRLEWTTNRLTTPVHRYSSSFHQLQTLLSRWPAGRSKEMEMTMAPGVVAMTLVRVLLETSPFSQGQHVLNHVPPNHEVSRY